MHRGSDVWIRGAGNDIDSTPGSRRTRSAPRCYVSRFARMLHRKRAGGTCPVMIDLLRSLLRVPSYCLGAVRLRLACIDMQKEPARQVMLDAGAPVF